MTLVFNQTGLQRHLAVIVRRCRGGRRVEHMTGRIMKERMSLEMKQKHNQCFDLKYFIGAYSVSFSPDLHVRLSLTGRWLLYSNNANYIFGLISLN